MEALTAQKLLEIMREVVAEAGPDYVYQRRTTSLAAGCMYVYGGQPDCLFGRILHRLGVSLDFLADHERKPAQELFETSGFALNTKLRYAIGRAQASQDMGHTWGYVLEQFEQELGVASVS